MPVDLFDYPRRGRKRGRASDISASGQTGWDDGVEEGEGEREGLRACVHTRKTGVRIVFGFNASVNNANNLFTSGTCSSECSRLSMAVSMNHSA